MFNTQAGLDSANKGYSFLFVKTVLSMCVKPLHTNFPGGWMKAAKDINQVKSQEGLLVRLGYVMKVADTHKLRNVIFTDAPILENTPCVLRPFDDKKDSLEFSEFRTVVALLLPKIDPSSEEAMDEQIKRDPMKVKSLHTLQAYQGKRQKCVDALNIANAYKVAIDSDRKSKAKPVHYEAARNHVLNLSHDVPLIDAKGVEYPTFSDIPAPVQKYLRKAYFYPERPNKRPATSGDADMKDVEDSSTSKKSRLDESGASSADAGVSLAQNQVGPKVARSHGVRRAPGTRVTRRSNK
jgi:hypothetical protein